MGGRNDLLPIYVLMVLLKGTQASKPEADAAFDVFVILGNGFSSSAFYKEGFVGITGDFR